MSKPTRARLSPKPQQAVRPLTGDDFARLVEIDRAITGRSRQGFYRKRLDALQKHPRDLVALGYSEGARLAGFVLAQVLDGEFGGRDPVAMLDAIGVSPDARHRGAGRALLAALDARLTERGVRELRTEASWAEPELLRLFAAAGFALAPRCILERPTVGSESI